MHTLKARKFHRTLTTSTPFRLNRKMAQFLDIRDKQPKAHITVTLRTERSPRMEINGTQILQVDIKYLGIKIQITIIQKL